MRNLAQLIAEAILPLLGFYVWGWSWYFILLFYILDLGAKETILHVQANKIYKTQGGANNRLTWRKLGSKSLLVAFFSLVTVHILQYMRYTDFSLSKEIIDFLGKKEWGIPQGMLLLPLVFLTVWLQYKQNFLRMNQHLKIKMTEMWQEHLRYRFFVLGTIAMGVGVSNFVKLPDTFLIWSTILLPFLYLRFHKRTK